MNCRKGTSPRRRRPDISRAYAHEEARGLVFFGDAYYGPSFKVVVPDGTIYSGFIDLFHFSESSGLNCLQIALDHPGAEETVAIHIRQYADGRIETLAE
jgi:hypothetical protein